MSRNIETRADYDEFVAAFNAFMQREEIDGFSGGTLEYYKQHGDFDGYEAEPDFSWSPCQCCGGTLGGNREDVVAYHKPSKQMVEFSVCEDCVYFECYHRLDDMTMLKVGGDNNNNAPAQPASGPASGCAPVAWYANRYHCDCGYSWDNDKHEPGAHDACPMCKRDNAPVASEPRN